jgi:hypothetical protein
VQPFAQHGNNRWVTRGPVRGPRDCRADVLQGELAEEGMPVAHDHRQQVDGYPGRAARVQAVPADGSAATAMTNAPTPTVTQENGAP